MVKIFSIIMSFSFLSVNAQEGITTESPRIQNDTFAEITDSDLLLELQNPKIISGQDARTFVAMNYKFPYEAMEEGIEGTIWAEFIVEKNGRVEVVNIIEGLCESCDKEAVRVIRRLRFHPIEIDGKPQRVRFRLPIRLMLQ